ncbi:hypothetical protein F2Q70_00011152 [Brassica cretica]|uniref:Uncharacterized protein n=1 Tax=Brassica cretica TaxID=69181 RepID=A0A8S9LQF1_BRACR|nr:hypothetical protein F2Q70_00011152 [Brassica cretica]
MTMTTKTGERDEARESDKVKMARESDEAEMARGRESERERESRSRDDVEGFTKQSKESVLFQELMPSRTRLFAIHPLVVMVLWILSVSGWLAVEMRLYSLVEDGNRYSKIRIRSSRTRARDMGRAKLG